MEIINKKHFSITQNTRVNMSAYFSIPDDKHIYFSAGANLQYGIMAGLYVHFQNDNDRWYFIVNNDPDGFRLLNRPSKNCSIICDASLVKLILKRTLISKKQKFLITKTNAKLNGCHVFELNINFPLTEDLKRA